MQEETIEDFIKKHKVSPVGIECPDGSICIMPNYGVYDELVKATSVAPDTLEKDYVFFQHLVNGNLVCFELKKEEGEKFIKNHGEEYGLKGEQTGYMSWLPYLLKKVMDAVSKK